MLVNLGMAGTEDEAEDAWDDERDEVVDAVSGIRVLM